MEPKSIQRPMVGGGWLEQVMPNVQPTGKKIIVFHSLNVSTRWDMAGTFNTPLFAEDYAMCVVCLAYSLIDTATVDLNLLNQDIQNGILLTTQEDKETFFNKWRAGQYRFSTEPCRETIAQRREEIRREQEERRQEEEQPDGTRRVGKWTFGPSQPANGTDIDPQHIGPREE